MDAPGYLVVAIDRYEFRVATKDETSGARACLSQHAVEAGVAITRCPGEVWTMWDDDEPFSVIALSQNQVVGGGLLGAGAGAAIGAAAAGGPGAALGAAIGGATGAVGGVATTPPPPYGYHYGYYGYPGY